MASPEVTFVHMSTLTEEGIAHVKEVACDKLLEQRVDTKLRAMQGMEGKSQDVLARLHVAEPRVRDNKVREAFVPESVAEAKASRMEGAPALPGAEDDEESDAGLERKPSGKVPPVLRDDFNYFHPDSKHKDPTVFGIDWRKNYKLANPEWRFDAIPEIVDGRNIIDYVDPDIEARLAELEREEEELLKIELAKMDDYNELNPEDGEDLAAFRKASRMSRILSSVKKRSNRPAFPKNRGPPKSLGQMSSSLAGQGLDPVPVTTRVRSASGGSQVRGRKREKADTMMVDGAERSASRSRSRSHSHSVPKPPSFANPAQRIRAEKLGRQKQFARNKDARKGEADRHVSVKRPKHLFSGKRTIGKTDRR
jgi:nucleolar GTP-binding protein